MPTTTTKWKLPSSCVDDAWKEKRGSRVPPARLFWAALTVGLGGAFQFGLQLTVTAPAHRTFLHFTNQSFREHHDDYGLKLAQIEAFFK
jgi:hypothetical protein